MSRDTLGQDIVRYLSPGVYDSDHTCVLVVAGLAGESIPTSRFHEAFAHTLIEADLLEDWTDTLTEQGRSVADAVVLFDTFIRRGEPSLQAQLLEPR